MYCTNGIASIMTTIMMMMMELLLMKMIISLLIALPSHQNIYLNPLHNFYNPLQGFILQSVGFSLWYWGYEVPYMREYISHYNAGVIDRISFYNILQSVRNFKHKSFRDIQSIVPIAIIGFPDDNFNET